MVLEAVILNIKEGQAEEYEKSFRKASALLVKSPGYLSHELHKCIETRNRYIMLIRWNTLDDHLVGFRQSDVFEQWKQLTRPFYTEMPTVEHFEEVNLK